LTHANRTVADIFSAPFFKPGRGGGVKIKNSVIGPYASIEKDVFVEDSTIKDSIIYAGSYVSDSFIKNSIIGSSSKIISNVNELIVGDFTNIRSHEK
jgi:NDP-sugar pyrophosphorylase family protein